jgi:hypothetical protein
MDEGGPVDPAILRLRETVSRTALVIEDFFAEYEHLCAWAKQEHDEFLATVAPDARSTIDAATRPSMNYSRLSDGLVLFLRMRSDAGRPSMGALLNLVNSCAILFVQQLAKGNPMRGGIDVGVGVEVTRQTGQVEIYGPAFLRAYDLESKKAEFPRIAAGQGLLDLLKPAMEQEAKALASQIEKKAASLIAERLYRSPGDDVVMIDVLGKPFAKSSSGVDVHDARKAHEFVIEQIKHWATDTSDEGRKLHGRYLKLADYFDRRMYLWG